MQKLVIIDGLSFFFRAYHAVRGELTRESDGLPTNALYGFCQMLLKVVKDMQPDLCCVALDSIGPTFRHTMYPAYKEHRVELDEAMKQQLPYFEPLIAAFGIAGIRVEGMEADDVIATLVARHKADKQVVIVSSDKDLMQLLGGNVTMLDTMKNKTFDPAAVVEKFGVGPDKVIEVQALIGDSSDNVPGVPSVGPKTAAQLIEQFGSVDGIYANLPEVKRDKLREKLAENKDQAYLSKKLVTLKQDVPLPANADLTFHPDLTGARDFLIELDFKTLAARLPNGKKAQEPPLVEDEEAYAPRPRYTAEAGTPTQTVDTTAYETVTTPARLTHWLNRCRAAGTFAVDTETTSIDPMRAELVGLSLAVSPNEACYIPVAHRSREEGLLAEPIDQLPKAEVLAALQPLLEDASLTKIAHNLKYDLIVLRNIGLDVVNFEDTMLLSAALDAGKHAHGLDLLSVQHFGHKMMSFADVAGRGQKQVTFDYVDLKEATAYAAEDADITLRLYQLLLPRLKELQTQPHGPAYIYEHMEKPLLPVLAEMERRGVLVDTAELGRVSQEFATRMAKHEARIFELAGEQFNVNSPKQLGNVLFTKLGLSVGKKKTTSTNVEVMEALADQGHTIANEVLAYRSVAKLRSTYTEALTQQVNPQTGRVHTSYNAVGAATGRMSSSDPNLQNIPIRTEDGRKIRHAFIAPQGWQLMSADYSQIELRLLAHFSKSEGLRQAFLEGQDVHRFTASRVFNVPLEEVTSEHRRIAKAVNFGLVYGMGATSLAKQVGITRVEAQEYIGRYFTRYDGVKDYMESNKQFCRDHGYVETLYGRRIHLPTISSSNGGLRAGAERAAINAPLQGSNADIIKLAMPRIEQALLDGGYQARMLMQVHDELVFEVPDAEVETIRQLVCNLMENAVTLAVPLKVEAGLGHNWEDAH